MFHLFNMMGASNVRNKLSIIGACKHNIIPIMCYETKFSPQFTARFRQFYGAEFDLCLQDNAEWWKYRFSYIDGRSS